MVLEISLLEGAVICVCLLILLPYLRSGARMPPGPLGWHVLGNMLQLGSHSRSHQAVASLAAKYGPVMTLRLGCMRTVVVSSSDAAREMYKVNDLSLAGRTLYEAMKIDISDDDHGTVANNQEASIITAQYGPLWRLFRRLCALEFFSSSRLLAMKGVRRQCIDSMVGFIRQESDDGKKAIVVSKLVFLMNFNLLGNLMFSRDLVDPKCEEGNEFFDLAGKIMELVGKHNLADFVPILKWLDPQGIKRKSHRYMEKAFQIIGGFAGERLQAAGKIKEERGKKDFLDVLLDFKGDGKDEPANFSPTVINGIALEMFIAGTDTTTSTVEWALTELLHNPAAMAKLRSELSGAIGQDRRIEEEDIDNLPYLRAVIKETLRMHPPLPLMVPHRAREPCTLMGYCIPKDTQVLVNAWAIGRDPKAWEDPHCFKPERFLQSTIDYKGRHFEYLPFGSGRRMCPGMPLAHRMLPLTLGTLLLSFDWVLPEGVTPETIDMREKLGISLKKAVPLSAIPVFLKAEPNQQEG